MASACAAAAIWMVAVLPSITDQRCGDLGSVVPKLQTFALHWPQFLGRTFAVSQRVDEALAALTLEQVNAALRRYLKPDALATAVAGDFKTP